MIFETHVDFVFQGVFQLQGGAQQVYITPDTEQPDSWSVLQTTSGETFKQTFLNVENQKPPGRVEKLSSKSVQSLQRNKEYGFREWNVIQLKS